MKVRVEEGRPGSFRCEVLLLFGFEPAEPLQEPIVSVDREWDGFLGTVIHEGDFRGELFECRFFRTPSGTAARRVVLLGLGKEELFDLERWRGAASKAGQFIRDAGLREFAVPLKALGGFALEEITEAFVTGFLLGTYQFNEFKTLDKDKIRSVEGVILLGETGDELQAMREGVRRGEIISEAVTMTRDLVNRPSNSVTPAVLADKAKEIAREEGMDVQVLEVAEAEAMGMGAFAAVARGTEEPAKFIVLEYNKGKGFETVALVGKGITFDSGGLSIKPAEKMERMKDDMSGAAAVLAVLQACSRLAIPLHLVGIMPCTENLLGGKAYKPGDVLKTLSGQTVEVISTDAEGRIVLSDALTYSLRYKPKAIIDLATLTGACVVALGDYAAGLFGNDESLLKRVEEASAATGEKVWRMPLWEEYFEYMKSDVADFKNVGTRSGGAIIGAIFLSKFVGRTPWAHIDIAGPALIEKERPYIPRGATGIGARLLLQLLRDWSAR
jgi:leucyl aminopeptidase